ncbi:MULTISPECIES: hypothetical protein [unclassified Streptomyces]|uniref:hypothetical protein n=1 Tax=unclassified Streptomyces TaxID=2593676 RepID=UPI003825E978
MLAGDTIYRIVWIPGTDRLRGWCWCGMDRESEDPVELWEWLLAHPEEHPEEGPGGRGGEPGVSLPGGPAPAPRQLVGA